MPLWSALLSLLLLAVSACGVAGHPGPPPLIGATPGAESTSRVQFGAPVANSLTHPYFAARITFAPGVSFSQALGLVTDLGLQPLYFCDTIPDTHSWHPLGEQAGFAQNTILEVAATPDAPSDWLARLNAARSVRAIFNGSWGCSLLVDGTPLPGYGYFLRSGEYLTYVGVVVQVRYGATVSYDQALATLSNLGFRLANPCFEQAMKTSAPPSWRSPGQAQSFRTTHVLVVATTTANSTLWQTQLLATPGVLAMEQPYQPTCAA